MLLFLQLLTTVHLMTQHYLSRPSQTSSDANAPPTWTVPAEVCTKMYALSLTFGKVFFLVTLKYIGQSLSLGWWNKCSADRQPSKYNTWTWFISRSVQSQIRPATHFNTLPSPHTSYGAFLAAFIHFTNGHIPIILNHLWEAHYPNDLAESLLTVGIYPFLRSLLHPVLS